MSGHIRPFLLVALTLVIVVFAVIGVLFVFDVGTTEEYKDAIVKAGSLIGIVTASLVLVTLLNGGNAKK